MRHPPEQVILRNVRQHNLKGITVAFPRRALSVVTGPSGSGKSSRAFDTLYPEGQRRYVESLHRRDGQRDLRLLTVAVGAGGDASVRPLRTRGEGGHGARGSGRDSDGRREWEH